MRAAPGGLVHAVDGRQARLPTGSDQFLGIEEALVIGTVRNRREVGVHLVLADGNAVDRRGIRRHGECSCRESAGQNNEENDESLHAPRMLQGVRSRPGVKRRH
jgi:hypothetical protein